VAAAAADHVMDAGTRLRDLFSISQARARDLRQPQEADRAPRRGKTPRAIARQRERARPQDRGTAGGVVVGAAD
jgi:hypothetical protein